MINRLSATAALFAVIATATLAHAAEPTARHDAGLNQASRASVTSPEIVVLPTVFITGKRS